MTLIEIEDRLVDPHCEDHNEYTDGCFGCKALTISIAPSAMPTRRNSVPPRAADPVWEKGKAGEHRKDGSFMPYLKEDGSSMGVKEYGEKRHEVDDRVRRLKNDENVFAERNG